MGNGIHHKSAGRPQGNQPEKLAAPDLIRIGDVWDGRDIRAIDKLSVVITLVLAFVFLHEEFTAKSIVGCVLIGAGTLMMVL